MAGESRIRSEHAEPFLRSGDPPPVNVLRPDGRSPFLLTCEHAGARLPRCCGDLGLTAHSLQRHIALDIGADGVSRIVSKTLDATLVTQTYSRLVVDCNRPPEADDFIVTVSEHTRVPGNVGITDAERNARARAIFHPYHDAITRILDEREAGVRPSVLVSLHSFTPVYRRDGRPWQIGVLYDRDPIFGRLVLEMLAQDPELCVGDNEPYALTRGRDYAVPVHGEARGIPHVELEIRHDLITSVSGQRWWGAHLATVLDKALGRFLALRAGDSGDGTSGDAIADDFHR